ncbi:MAG: glutamate racemase [Patescibacteria group bacterium]|jgi:glutamate racemase
MIGIFDSGIGGLTVTREVLKQLPEYQLLYLGDTARLPYGNRSQELIYQFTEQAVDYLFKQGCELVILACNTASAEALRKIQQEWLPKNYPDRRVLGVIRPLAEEAIKVSRFGRIGVVGTRATISSEAYQRELRNQKSEIRVFSQACPLLVPLIEEGWQKRPETMKILRNYLRPLKQQKIDTLILGCTHYPILLKQFQNGVGKSIKVFDPAKVVAEKLKDYLARHPEIKKKLVKGTNHRYLVTDMTEIFIQNAEAWLGQKIKLEKVELG